MVLELLLFPIFAVLLLVVIAIMKISGKLRMILAIAVTFLCMSIIMTISYDDNTINWSLWIATALLFATWAIAKILDLSIDGTANTVP